MLHALDESLAAFLRATVPLPPGEVDLSFDPPSPEWAECLSRQTLNVYLWDVRPICEDRDSGVELIVGPEGVRRRRPPLPRVGCRYWVTAWARDVSAEHALLGATLRVLLGNPEIDPHLPLGYSETAPPPTIEIAAGSSLASPYPDVRPRLDGYLKPGLDVVVSATVEPPEVPSPDELTHHRLTRGSDHGTWPGQDGW
jgi:hypothetical protein